MFRKYLLCILLLAVVSANVDPSWNTPNAPVISWTDGGLNSGSQTIVINQPVDNRTSTSPPIGIWRVSYNVNGIKQTELGDSYPSVVTIPIIVSDNSTVNIQTYWYRTSGTVSSNCSDVTTRVIPDRTPPSVNSVSPTNNATGIALNVPITINWSDKDINQNGVTKNATTNIQINGSNLAPSGTISKSASGVNVTGTWTYTPSLKYNQIVPVSVLLYDYAGNYMTSAYTFTYRTTMNAPLAPSASWLNDTTNSPLNSSSNQKIRIDRPSTTNTAGGGTAIDNITQWNARWKYSTGHAECLAPAQ